MIRRRPSSRLRKDLHHCSGDGMTHAFMVGLGETNFPLFALALGATEGTAGLVATVPQLVGAVLQLCAPWGVARFGSPRRWIIFCATVQFLSFVPMVVGAWMGTMPMWVLFAAAAIYWAVNLGAGPAWNTWVVALFPPAIRVAYFGRRSRLYQFSTLTALIVGGLILHMLGATMLGFALLFVLASASRLSSLWFLKRQSEPSELDLSRHRQVGMLDFIRRISHSPDARVLVAMVAMTLSVQVAQPFLVPYMSKQLMLSDSWVLAMIAISFLGKSLSAPLWGRYANRRGARRLFLVGGLAVVPITVIWMLCTDLWLLLALQAFTGAAFGALELGFFFLSFEAIREEERTSLLATYLLLNSAAAALGSLAGNAVLAYVPAIATAYAVVFAGSALLRWFGYLLMQSVRLDVPHAQPLATQPMALRASAGSIDFPEPASLRHELPHFGEDAPT